MDEILGGNGVMGGNGAMDTPADGRTDGKTPAAAEEAQFREGVGDVGEVRALAVIAQSPAPRVAAGQAPPGDRHPALVYLARLAPGSRRTMGEALHAMAGRLSAGRCDLWTLAWHELRYQHTAALRSLLAEQYAPATVNKMLAALRGTLKECWRLGLVSAEDYHRAADIPAVRGSVLPRGRALSSGELRALLAACAGDRTAAGARDGALVATLYGAGLRRSEAVALEVRDYDRETGALTVRSGKGRKERIAYAPSGCRAALAAWLGLRGGDPASPLFVPIGKSGRLGLKALCDQAVLYVLRKKGAEAGLAAFSPHDLRRTFIGDLLDAGADISTVQQMAGHASVQTTARYDRRGEGAKRKAAELLHVPFREG
jgi:site-specific recombinase XerD